mgnify:CR=1 FL=1
MTELTKAAESAAGHARVLQQQQRVAQRLGVIVILVLAALTAIEYAVAVAVPGTTIPYLALIAIAKAALIAYYFMHIYHLWRREGGHR